MVMKVREMVLSGGVGGDGVDGYCNTLMRLFPVSVRMAHGGDDGVENDGNSSVGADGDSAL